MRAVLRRVSVPLIGLTALTTLGVPVLTMAPASASGLPAAVTHRVTIHPGDTGAAVSWLQRDLGVKAGTGIGTYGPKTLTAVEHFQKAYGLTADGVIGAATWRALLGGPRTKAVTATTKSTQASTKGKSGWICPVGPKHDITNSFGDARPGGRHHEGDDVMAPRSTPIYAVQSGVIGKAGHGAIAGYEIILRGSSGNSFFYAHQSVNLVHTGEHVTAGQVIARVGNTGDAAGGPTHLHFEYWPGGGTATDPYSRLKSACD